jgi:hypothetical protein
MSLTFLSTHATLIYISSLSSASLSSIVLGVDQTAEPDPDKRKKQQGLSGGMLRLLQFFGS